MVNTPLDCAVCVGPDHAHIIDIRVYLKRRHSPMYDDYVQLLEQGSKPPIAKLTIARKIAATVLVMWKNREAYDPQRDRNKG